MSAAQKIKPIRADVVRVEIVLVTPEQAGAWLIHNPRNRPLRRNMVAKYAADMTSGNWHVSHQGIALAPDGAIVDGQHRLSAIVLAGASVLMLVCHYGSEESANRARLVCDTGSKKSAGDVLVLADVLPKDHAREIVAMICAIHLLDDTPLPGAERNGSSLTVAEIAERYAIHKDSIQWAISSLTDHTRFPAPLRAAFAFAWSACPSEVADFAEAVKAHESSLWSKTAERGGLRTKGGGSERQRVMWRALRIIKAAVLGEALTKIQTSGEGRDFFAAKLARKTPR